MEIGRLAQLAGRIVCDLLARQEGFSIGFQVAIVRTREGDYSVGLGSRDRPALARLEERPGGQERVGRSPGLKRVHPPTFDIRDWEDDPKLPLHIPYSCMAGPLAGRGGYLILHPDGRFVDEVRWMS